MPLDRDGIVWHALYCPNRRQLVVVEMSHTMWQVNREHLRARDADGRTHLCTVDELGNVDSRCGVPVAEPIDAHPDTFDDPFAHWFDATWCRDCLRAADRKVNGPR